MKHVFILTPEEDVNMIIGFFSSEETLLKWIQEHGKPTEAFTAHRFPLDMGLPKKEQNRWVH